MASGLVKGDDKEQQARRLYKQLLEGGDELTTTATLKQIFVSFLREHAKGEPLLAGYLPLVPPLPQKLQPFLWLRPLPRTQASPHHPLAREKVLGRDNPQPGDHLRQGRGELVRP